jgi:hypothetical protein
VASILDSSSLDIRLGVDAQRHIAERGLAPHDISCVPAAAGGPKGLALLPFDRLFAREWLPKIARLELIGASVGAWRMAALSQADPVQALDRLLMTYVHDQNYPHRASPAQVAAICRRIARSVSADATLRVADGKSLSIITARARGPLVSGTRSAFARAAFANTLGRHRLAAHLQRVVFQAGAASRLPAPADRFGYELAALTRSNVDDALPASGSIPLVCDPVRNIGGAPPGDYWDGGLIDYHLLLPYRKLDGLVLYPHFVPWVTPGWLDKSLRWRARSRGHAWLSNVILIAPSAALLARLPGGRLPDRSDFYRHGADHAARIAAWERAIAECARFADAALGWLDRPDLSIARPL